MSNRRTLRVSPFGLIATPAQDEGVAHATTSDTEAAASRHRARRYVPCSRERRIRTATLPPTSWLAICIAVEESELEDGDELVSIH